MSIEIENENEKIEKREIKKEPKFNKLEDFLEESKCRDFGLNLNVQIIKHINILKNTRPDKTE